MMSLKSLDKQLTRASPTPLQSSSLSRGYGWDIRERIIPTCAPSLSRALATCAGSGVACPTCEGCRQQSSWMFKRVAASAAFPVAHQSAICRLTSIEALRTRRSLTSYSHCAAFLGLLLLVPQPLYVPYEANRKVP